VSENKIDLLKSQNISTDCRHCIWALTDKEGNQKGCLAGRLDRFREAGAWVGKESSEDTHYQIERVCNLHRTEEWSNYDEDFEDATLFDKDDLYLTKASDEIKTTFGIVIYDTEDTHEKLEQTAFSIADTTYDKTRIKIVISAIGRKQNVYEYIRIVESLKTDGFNVELIMNSNLSPKELRDFEAFNKCSSYTHLAACDSGATMASSTLSRIEEVLNGKLEKVMTFSQNSLFGRVDFIMKSIARSEYLKYNDFHKMLIEVKKLSSENKMHRDL